MSIPRPKILTRVTVPSGGWQFKVYYSSTAQYDTPVTGTVPAGDYYVCGDGQSDDLLEAAAETLNSVGAGSNVAVRLWIDADHKVNIGFYGSGVEDATGDNDVKIEWTTCSELAAALGFDDSADDTSTTVDAPTFVADWQHAYGWYATEDGQLADLVVVPTPMAQVSQRRALNGQVVTQDLGSVYDGKLSLQFIEEALMFSAGNGYTDAPTYPYARNKGLECWWYEALQGVEFRVYRDGLVDKTRAIERGSATAVATNQVTDSNKAWDTDPYPYTGMVVYFDEWDAGGVGSTTVGDPGYAYITSGGATTISHRRLGYGVANSFAADVGDTYYVLDHRYETWVVDLSSMRGFEYRQTAQGLSRYDIEIPLLRYEA